MEDAIIFEEASSEKYAGSFGSGEMSVHQSEGSYRSPLADDLNSQEDEQEDQACLTKEEHNFPVKVFLLVALGQKAQAKLESIMLIANDFRVRDVLDVIKLSEAPAKEEKAK